LPTKLELIEEAKSCNNCESWLHNCQAACCKQFKIKKTDLKKTHLGYEMMAELKEDDCFYYRLHGVYVQNNKLIIIKKKFVITEEGEFIIFHRDCDYLTNNHCKEHASGDRPETCKGFNELTGKNNDRNSYAVPMCLCNFKK